MIKENRIEIEKLTNILKLPISDIKFESTYCEVFCNERSIGTLPIFIVNSIIHYDTTENLGWLNWSQVYLDYKATLARKIRENLGLKDDFSITIGKFRNLIIRENSGKSITTVECRFENGDWEVVFLS